MNLPIKVASAISAFVALLALTVPQRLSAGIIYSTLPASAGDYYDNYQVSNGLGVSFNSGDGGSLSTVELNLGAGGSTGSVDIQLFANTAQNRPDFSDGELDDLGVIPDTAITSGFETLNVDIPLAADTEYWIVTSANNSPAWWRATFLSIPAVAADAIDTAGQFVEIRGTSYSIASNDAFELQVSTADVATPEPASFALFGAGLAGIMLVRRRLY